MADHRLIIYSADICRMTHKSERAARALLAKIRTHYNKHQHQFVSVNEFCEYMGFREDEVRDYLRPK